jgi:DNA uptake protein ComE-like DNA-binding protein
MAIPELSPEARAEALEKAKAARLRRAKIREELKAKNITVAEVLEMREDPIVGRMKISTLIETLPGYGKAKAQRIMKDLQIAESRRIRGIGERQREALLQRLTK